MIRSAATSAVAASPMPLLSALVPAAPPSIAAATTIAPTSTPPGREATASVAAGAIGVHHGFGGAGANVNGHGGGAGARERDGR